MRYITQPINSSGQLIYRYIVCSTNTLIIIDIRNGLKEDDIIISEIGAHKLWLTKGYNTFSPNMRLISIGFYSIGFALLGAIVGQPARPINKLLQCVDMEVFNEYSRIGNSCPFKIAYYNRRIM
jgi:hypothetical protein